MVNKQKKDEAIPLDVENINCLITHWRKRKAIASTTERKLIAVCYIDALQTVRVNHGLPLLPEEE